MQEYNARDEDLADIDADIKTLEEDKSLYAAANFNKRANAIDFIDVHLVDRIDSLPQNEKLDKLKQRTLSIKTIFEDIDSALFARLRHEIRNNGCDGPYFIQMVSGFFPDISGHGVNQSGIGYDNLDIFINRLLAFDHAPAETVPLGDEMVFYQKTPARVVFEMARMAALNEKDVFFDIGSGLGQVAILIKLITGAKTIGIEYEPAYCKYADNRARELDLSGIDFINIDASLANYTGGTVFFLYTPFMGSILKQVLLTLQTVFQSWSIQLFTYGPLSAAVSSESWLQCVNGNTNDPYELCSFRSC